MVRRSTGAHRTGSRSLRLSVRAKLALSVAVVIAIATTGVGGSWAAWTVATANTGNTLSTNTILLQDNQGAQGGSAVSAGTAMFTVANLEPGSSATTRCVGVVFAGTASAASLTLSAALAGGGQAALQGQLTVDAATYNTSGTVAVTGGSNTNNGSCTNYPAGGSDVTIGAQGATMAAWSAGGPYVIATAVTNTWYKVTVSGLPGGANDCAVYCGKTITLALTWTLTTT
jgi:hypothetical protein